MYVYVYTHTHIYICLKSQNPQSLGLSGLCHWSPFPHSFGWITKILLYSRSEITTVIATSIFNNKFYVGRKRSSNSSQNFTDMIVSTDTFQSPILSQCRTTEIRSTSLYHSFGKGIPTNSSHSSWGQFGLFNAPSPPISSKNGFFMT